MRLRELMRTNLSRARRDTPFGELVAAHRRRDSRLVYVVDEADRLLGVVSCYDLLRAALPFYVDSGLARALPEDATVVREGFAAAFARMKPSAILVNTGRGPIIDEAALVVALRQGRIAGAGLDVYEFEPRLAEGLAELANVVITPHIGSATAEARDGMAVLAARNLVAMLEGTTPPTCFNPEVLARP